MKVNGTELADVFSVTHKTINTWDRDGMPIDERVGTAGNVYDTAKCIEWYTNRAITKRVGNGNSVYTLETERARLAHHQANNEALKEAQLKGDLIATADVLKQWGDAIMAMRNKMLAIPSKLAKTAINAESVKEIERDAEKMVHEALNELMIYEQQSTGNTTTSTGTGETTAETESEPVGRQLQKTKRRGIKRAGAMVN